MKYANIIIIGAGASGLMLASNLKNKDFLILEQNNKIAKKLSICGGGKCNLTNKYVSYSNYLGDKEFVKTILNNFSKDDLLNFLKQHNLNPVLKKGKYYFCPTSSSEIIDIFRKKINKNKILLNHAVVSVTKENNLFTIKTSNNKTFTCKNLVVCSGGISYPKIGTSKIAYEVASNFNHNVTKLNPALVGFTVQKNEFWFKNLSGVSFYANVSINNKTFKDDILFTHKGISGPAILNASVYWEKGNIEIDFLPKENLNNFLKSKKQISTILPLPKRFVLEFLKSFNLKDRPFYLLSKEDLKKLSILKNYTFSPAGTFGFNKAEVTKGGISTNEIDPNNLMSKLENNLFFLGEALDVTGELGGYNLQFAFSCANTCSKYLNN